MNKLCIALLTVATASGQSPLPASGNVTVPLDEYNKLIELSSHPQKKPEAPPFSYVLKAANLNLTVNGSESAVGTLTIEGEVLAKGVQRVPLATGLIVLDAQQKGGELSLVRESGGLFAVLSGPRDFAITLTVATPLVIETGRASLVLPIPNAGACTLTLAVPGEQAAVNLAAGLITNRSSREGKTTVEATLVPGQTVSLWWASRLAPVAAPPKEVRFLSDVKTLVSVTDADVSLAVLANVNVVQGDPVQFRLAAPEGYEMTGASGATLTASEPDGKFIRLTVASGAVRSHQFLITMVKPNGPGAAKADVALLSFVDAQRETGEVLIEGEGAIDLRSGERGGLRRMDAKETSMLLRSLGHAPVHAAFRYQKKPAEMPGLALEWTRFPDSSVLSAVAQQGVVTTLVTSEGRSLTEVKLTLKNQSQPFLKVGLAAGDSILSADVAGEKVKPAQGPDGSRVPLLRPGFRPKDSYTVSFVILHAGKPFEKKGMGELALPKMDIPIGLVQWEVFMPKQFRVADFGGDALPAAGLVVDSENADEPPVVPASAFDQDPSFVVPGQIRGVVTDQTGSAIDRALVTLNHGASGTTLKATANSSGRWMIQGMPSGRINGTVESPGFKRTTRQFDHDANRGTSFSVVLQVGNATDSVEVSASNTRVESQQIERNYRQNAAALDLTASVNVAELQRRVVGVLPIAVNVPKSGNSYRFVRPLTVDEETKLTFSYRTGK